MWLMWARRSKARMEKSNKMKMQSFASQTKRNDAPVKTFFGAWMVCRNQTKSKAKAWQQNNKFAGNAVIFELVQGLTSQQLFALVCKKLNNKVQIKRMNTWYKTVDSLLSNTIDSGFNWSTLREKAEHKRC